MQPWRDGDEATVRCDGMLASLLLFLRHGCSFFHAALQSISERFFSPCSWSRLTIFWSSRYGGLSNGNPEQVKPSRQVSTLFLVTRLFRLFVVLGPTHSGVEYSVNHEVYSPVNPDPAFRTSRYWHDWALVYDRCIQ